MWTDEDFAVPIEVSWNLRQVYAFRTKIMLGEEDENRETWIRLNAMFPNWMGFLPER